MARIALVFAILLGAGCASEHQAADAPQLDGGDVGAPCDPFAPQPQPIELGAVLAAGEDAEGTIYVVSRPSSGEAIDYVFVSDGMELIRHRVAGTGEYDRTLELSVTEHTPPFRLLVFLDAPAASRMQLAPPEGRGVPLPSEAETLTPVDGDRIDALTLRNLPGDVLFEHGGELPHGRVLIVTRPEDDWSYEDFRVFLGPPEEIVERRVQQASRGGETHIEFDVDGQLAEAVFHSAFSGDPPPDDYIWIGDEIFLLSPLDEPPDGARFVCAP